MTSLTADNVRPLESHAIWTSADVADPTEWTHALTDDQITELENAVAVARAATDEILDVTADDFPLPTLSPVLATIAAELIDGRGFHRISGIPVERVGFDDASWMYWGIGRHIGDPWPQNAKGHLLGDVKDQGKAYNDPTARGNEIGGSALTFHSDGSDLVGLMCLDPGVSGGESLVSNAVAAHNNLVDTEPELAGALYDGLPYDFRGEQKEGGTPFYKVPVFSRHTSEAGDKERLFVRYIRPYIEASQRHADAPRLSDAHLTAMDAYDAFVTDPDNQVEMKLETGDIQFVNNYHVLHGRREYVDDPAAGKVRWLKRLWLSTKVLGPGDRPERYQAVGQMNHWGDKRTKA